MSGFEWFLLIVVVILVPLAVAVGVTLWTLEMARQRNSRNRPGGKVSGTKRQATRPEGMVGSTVGSGHGRGDRSPESEDAGGGDGGDGGGSADGGGDG